MDLTIGVYGKLPCLGDFFHRGLSTEIIENLDAFHSQCLYALQNNDISYWQKNFTGQGIWNTYIPSGVLGEDAFIGIISPSQDKVGRMFPLTVLVALPEYLTSFIFSSPFSDFLATVHEIIINSKHQSAINVDIFFQALSDATQNLNLWQASVSRDINPNHAVSFGKNWSARDVAAIHWMLEHKNHNSIWWNGDEADENKVKQFAYFSGLPSIAQYLALVANPSVENEPKAAASQQLPNIASCYKPKITDAINSTANKEETQTPKVDTVTDAHINEPHEKSYVDTPLINTLEPDNDYEDPLLCVELIGDLGTDNGDNCSAALPASTHQIAPTTQETPEQDGDVMLNLNILAENPGNDIHDSSLTLSALAFSHIGNVREKNEDAYFQDDINGIWIVADGMGGLQHGDLASQKVTEYASRTILSGDIFKRTTQLMAQLQEANQQIFQNAHQQGYRCGSTVVALLYHAGQCSVIWAGDSRLYKLSHNALEQLTEDHINDSYENGRSRHGINRAVGTESEVKLASSFFSILPGDRLLLCTDGLYGYLNQNQLRQLLSIESQKQCSDQIKQTILATEARDNLTAVFVDVV